MSEQWKWYVYIIECEDGSYYTGMTWCPADRWEQHAMGCGSVYTSKHKSKEIVYMEEFEDFGCARNREKQIKGWTRKKKQNLISGEWVQYWD